jgi:hypothetical protein
MVPPQRSEVAHFNPDDPASMFMQTNVFEQLQRVAKLMASSQLVPKHLQGNAADCFLVVSQAVQWKMNPFAVAQSCYVLQGKVGYEGKLIAAIVNSYPRLAKKLNYEYSGTGAQRQVRVFGTLKGEDAPREVIGKVSDWKTSNRQWETQTDQMLSYRGAREWARRHMPEAVLGVYAEEELVVVANAAPVVVEAPSLTDVTGVVVEAQDDPGEEIRSSRRKPNVKKLEPEPIDAEPIVEKDSEIDKLFTK